MKKEDKKGKKIDIKEIWNNPKEKAFLFFGGYFIFFIIVILMLRTNYSSNKNTTNKLNNNYNYNYNSDSVDGYSLSNIKNNNYHFKYTENINNEITIFDGDRYKNKELFTSNYNYIITSFYRDDDIYLTKQNDAWTKVDNPFLYSSLSEYKTIKKILEKAMKESTTEYKNGKAKINYSISTTTLVKILDNKNIDIADEANSVTIKLDKNKNVYNINYNFSSYLTYKLNTTAILDINLNYTDIDQIQKIETPN